MLLQSDWWEGTLLTGECAQHRGMVPSNYVRVIASPGSDSIKQKRKSAPGSFFSRLGESMCCDGRRSRSCVCVLLHLVV